MPQEDYSEFYTTQEYDEELNKILTIGDPCYAALFYHSISKAIFEDESETVSDVGYAYLCDFLTENFSELPFKLQESINKDDLLAGNCSLKKRINNEPYVPGVHFFDEADLYLKELEDNMLISFKVEVWEDDASTD
jgi:hypothetical protein